MMWWLIFGSLCPPGYYVTARLIAKDIMREYRGSSSYSPKQFRQRAEEAASMGLRCALVWPVTFPIVLIRLWGVGLYRHMVRMIKPTVDELPDLRSIRK